jgi:hypothetical protein
VTPDERVTALYDLADHWLAACADSILDVVAELLPHTDPASGADYVSEAADLLNRARAIRNGADPAPYLDPADVRDLTGTQQTQAAAEDAECTARDVLVRAVTADDALAAQERGAA